MHGHQKQRVMSIDEAQQMVDLWIKTTGVRYFNELTNMTILTEEVGELARVMARSMESNRLKQEKKTILAKS